MLSVRDIVAAGRAGAAPDSGVAAAFDAIAARDGAVQAFATLDETGARAAARTAAGALAGVPVGVKDIIDVAGLPTQIGSPVWRGFMPKADAAVTTLLRRAGAAIIGKTHTTPFAFLDPAPTRNPHNLDYSPGGSSAGSAAGVAAGMIALGIGTQTGGSMIRPASYCGVAAIKPSFRLLPTVGVKCYSWSLDTLGLFAASVADAAFALAAMTGRNDLYTDDATPRKFRIGVTHQSFAGAAEPASQQALAQAVKKIAAAGHAIFDLDLPAECAAAWHAHLLLSDYEALIALGWEWDHRREELPPKLTAALHAASAFSVADYDKARRTAKTARRAIYSVFDRCDVILTYAAPGEAPHGRENSTGTSQFNRLWTILGAPCVNVAGLSGPNGLPVGIQVIAPFARDATALQASHAIEGAIRE